MRTRQSIFAFPEGDMLVTFPDPLTLETVDTMDECVRLLLRGMRRRALAAQAVADGEAEYASWRHASGVTPHNSDQENGACGTQQTSHLTASPESGVAPSLPSPTPVTSSASSSSMGLASTAPAAGSDHTEQSPEMSQSGGPKCQSLTSVEAHRLADPALLGGVPFPCAKCKNPARCEDGGCVKRAQAEPAPKLNHTPGVPDTKEADRG